MATILVADDHPGMRNIFTQVLEDDGHFVLTASNGQEAVDLARQAWPDLILMDLNLPVLDGWAATAQIKSYRHLITIPIIAVSVHAAGNSHDRAFEAGCTGFLPKPVNLNSLREIVESYLRQRNERVLGFH